jgi:hypothetical protein
VDSVSAALVNMIREVDWEEIARSCGNIVRTVCDIMDALDFGVDVKDYPRVMYESTRILESIEGEQQQANAGRRDERQQQQPHREKQRQRGQEQREGRGGSRSKRETRAKIMRRQRKGKRTREMGTDDNILNPRGHGGGIRTRQARGDGTSSTA